MQEMFLGHCCLVCSTQATAGACLPTSGEHVVEAAKKGGLQSTLLKLTNKKPAEVQVGSISAAAVPARAMQVQRQALQHILMACECQGRMWRALQTLGSVHRKRNASAGCMMLW